MIKVTEIDTGIEELVIAGMVYSEPFLQQTYKATLPEYFNSDAAKILCSWCREYFDTTGTAPKNDIEEVYEVNSPDLPEDSAIVVKTLLTSIISTYKNKTYNHKYIADKALPYLESNALLQLSANMRILVKRGELDKARQLREFSVKEVFKRTTKVTDITSSEVTQKVFSEKQQAIFEFGGALGKYLHPLKRGKLIAFLGPPKRGKTFWLLEWAFQAYHSGCKVIFFSLEMQEEDIYQRFIERLTGKELLDSLTVKKKKYRIPVMDCVKNQSGACKRPDCTSPGTAVLDSQDKMTPFEENKLHRACVVCRGKKNRLFEPASWFEEVEKKTLSRKEAEKALKMIHRDSNGGSLKVQTFPIRTAGVSDIESVLNDLELMEKWIPDVVVIDYAGIIKEDYRVSTDKRHRVGDIWENLSRIAKSRNVQLVTAGQGNRGAKDKDRLSATDMAEDWSIIMTLDALIGINEGGQETRERVQKDKYWQRQFIEILECRYKELRPTEEVMTLNALALGQAVLDSEIVY